MAGAGTSVVATTITETTCIQATHTRATAKSGQPAQSQRDRGWLHAWACSLAFCAFETCDWPENWRSAIRYWQGTSRFCHILYDTVTRSRTGRVGVLTTLTQLLEAAGAGLVGCLLLTGWGLRPMECQVARR